MRFPTHRSALRSGCPLSVPPKEEAGFSGRTCARSGRCTAAACFRDVRRREPFENPGLVGSLASQTRALTLRVLRRPLTRRGSEAEYITEFRQLEARQLDACGGEQPARGPGECGELVTDGTAVFQVCKKCTVSLN